MGKIDSAGLTALAAALLLAGGCSAASRDRQESAETEPAAPAAARGVLTSSAPANGARLSAVPTRLVLDFARPVRLAEVTVKGTDGLEMPMMVSSAGANRRYELPLDGLGRGSYTIHWRAIDEAQHSHEGDISFEIS